MVSQHSLGVVLEGRCCSREITMVSTMSWVACWDRYGRIFVLNNAKCHDQAIEARLSVKVYW